MSQLYWGLRDLLLTLPDPQTLHKAISQAIKCANHLFQRRQDQSPRHQVYHYNATMTTRNLGPHLEAEDMQIDAGHIRTLILEEKTVVWKKMIMFVLRRRRPQGCKLLQENRTVALLRLEARWSQKTTMPSHNRNRGAGQSNVTTTIGFLFFYPIYPLFYNFFVFRSSIQKTLVLLDLGASTCFLDEEFAKQYKIRLVQKSKPIHVEVIVGRPLLSSSVTHKSEPIKVTFKDYSSYVVFNIINIPSKHVIIGLSWLVDHNPSMDRRLRRIIFRIKAKLVRRPQIKKSLFIGARTFIRSFKEGTTFVIYATPTRGETIPTASIQEQYKDFQDVFQRKNADMLPEYRPYDCAIDLKDEAQPPFGPISNLSQTELAELRKYIDKNVAKISFVTKSC